MPGCPIRKSTDQVICADPRGLSQLITSFIASESLGIHRVPFLTFFSAYPFAVYADAFCYLPANLSAATGEKPPRRIKAADVSTVVFSSIYFFFQYVKERSGNRLYGPRLLFRQTGNITAPRCGEYRSRTDDLLRARQAL